MDNSEIVQHLVELAHTDIDAINAYQQAIKEIDQDKYFRVKQKLEEFLSDHERHYGDLSNAIRRLGGEPPEKKPDIKGFLLEGFTAIRSLTGIEGALKAMETNEIITNKLYEKAAHWEVSAEIKSLILMNYNDEKAHLQYIQSVLQEKPWNNEK